MKYTDIFVPPFRVDFKDRPLYIYSNNGLIAFTIVLPSKSACIANDIVDVLNGVKNSPFKNVSLTNGLIRINDDDAMIFYGLNQPKFEGYGILTRDDTTQIKNQFCGWVLNKLQEHVD